VIPVILGVALVALFVAHTRRVEHPLLDLKLYSIPAFSAASVVTFCLGAAMFGAMILLPLYFQTVRGQDALQTGLLLIPQGIGGGIGMGLSGRVTERLGAGRCALIGGVILSLATVPFTMIGASTPFVLIAAPMVARGLGVGLAFMPAMTAAFSVLAPDQVNDASPQLSVLQRVGGSLGTTIIAVVLEGNLVGARTPAAAAAAFAHTYWWVLAASIVALVPTAMLARIERRSRAAPGAATIPAAEALLEAA
jgi:predicted MFS family arabinose efflux permease